jgi:hypothetical protein
MKSNTWVIIHHYLDTCCCDEPYEYPLENVAAVLPDYMNFKVKKAYRKKGINNEDEEFE